MFKGGKLSKSRGTAVNVPYFLSRYDPDALRYYLTATAPETRDTEFSWEDFVERNNHVLSIAEGNELVATARLSSRRSLGQPGPKPKSTWVRPRRALGFMLSFAYKRFEGVVPEPGGLDDEDRALLEKVEAGF
jgi:methionyl-tRNA synthetase